MVLGGAKNGKYVLIQEVFTFGFDYADRQRCFIAASQWRAPAKGDSVGSKVALEITIRLGVTSADDFAPFPGGSGHHGEVDQPATVLGIS